MDVRRPAIVWEKERIKVEWEDAPVVETKKAPETSDAALKVAEDLRDVRKTLAELSAVVDALAQKLH